VLRPVHHDEIRRTSQLHNAGGQIANPRGVSGGITKYLLRRNVAEAPEESDHPQNPEWLRPTPGRRVGAQDDAFRLSQLKSRAERVQRRQLSTIGARANTFTPAENAR
jgi:hypothetical protein